MNLYQYLKNAADSAPNKLFLIKESVSYSEFIKRIARRAAILESDGVVAGDVVGILARNIPEFLITAWAAWQVGARVLLLDNKLTHDDYENMTSLVNCKIVYAEERFIFQTKKIKFCDICAPDKDIKKTPKIVDVSGDEIATLQFTSGSTGVPKIVPLTHNNLIAAADGLEDLRGYIDDGDDFLLFLPLFHIFGLAFITLNAIHYRGGVVLETSGNPREIVKNFRIYKPRVVPAVPRIWEIIRNMIISEYKNHGTWSAANWILRHQKLLRFFHLNQLVRQMQWPVHEMFGRRRATLIGGGAAVKPEIIEFFEWFGFDFLQGYGLTEGSGPNCVSLPRPGRYVGSVGMPLRPNDFRIQNQDKSGVGELWLRGPMIFSGYLDNVAATNEIFNNGWMNTGDLARTDKNGEIHICGRAKNVIVLGSGKNVFPDELEAAYITIDGVKNVMVIEFDGRVFGIFQVDDYITLEKLGAKIEVVNKKIAPYKQVVHFAITTENLPATSSGKNRHFIAKELLKAGAYPNRK
ncbi:MAG: acyl--CoA ligase [Rickettsiales bacterium]|jgi:long-chain acyl-CoA synthetase|nr:acyl--CoA ligase [Rickettsiales bacterium]